MRAARALRFPFSWLDIGLAWVGFSLTFWLVLLSLESGTAIGFGLVLGLALFVGMVVTFMVAPHIAIAVTIPFFALLPAIKVLVVPWIGGSKDVIVFAAVLATGLVTLQRITLRQPQPIDLWILLLVGGLLGLYVLNIGGEFNPASFGIAWFHGVRLVAEPLLLLLVGLSVEEPRRVLRWAIGSLVATGVFVAFVGLVQQVVGGEYLVALGYEYDVNVRTISGYLRSFGTLDEPFGYAAFLLSALAAVFFMRRNVLVSVAGVVIAAGLVFSLVRTAAVVTLALLGLWLVRRHQVTAAVVVIAVAAVAAVAFLVSATATETRTVRGGAGASTYLTINGRTDAWSVALGGPMDWVFGRGVGVVGTAAERATLSVSGTREDAEAKEAEAVDSGYFAAVADVGLMGLALLLALVGRLFLLGSVAARRGDPAGWFAIAVLTVMVLDATTRASFTGFPTAFLGMLVVGVAIAAGSRGEPSAEPTRLRRTALAAH